MNSNASSEAVVPESGDMANHLKRPNFFIVGAAKAGTTSLYNYLKLHPEVYFSPIKEPHFFSKDIRLENMREEFRKNVQSDISNYLKNSLGSPRHGAFVRNIDHYTQLFSLVKNEKRIGESSVSYLFSTLAARQIKHFNPDAKIIIILREPVERAFSHYLMDLRIGYEKAGFFEAVNADIQKERRGWGQSHLYVELGLYYEQVKRYMDVFSPSQIKLILHDDFKNSPEELLSDLYSFLGISDKSPEIDFSIRHNKAELPKSRMLQRIEKVPFVQKILADYIPGSIRRKLKSGFYSTDGLPKLTIEDRKALIPYFHDDVIKLSRLIDRDLSGWLKHA